MKEIHRHIRLSIIAGTFFSLLFYFGTKFLNATFDFKVVHYSVLDIAFIIPIIIAASLAFYFLFDIKIKQKADKNFNLKRWHLFLPLVLISLVFLLTFFPGHYPYDTAAMYKAFQTGSYTTHYPPLASFFVGLFLSFGKLIGSEAAGHAILVVFQILFVNFVIATVIFYLSKKLKQKSFGIILTLFFFLNPLAQMILIRSGQDIFFGGFFLLLCFEFLKISEDENYFKEKLRQKLLYFFVLIFLLCAFRNNGLYMLIPVLLTAFFVLKNKELRKRFFIAVSIPIIAFLGYNYLLIGNIAAIKESFFKETLNVPVMQIARSMFFNPDGETLEKLKRYFKEDCETWVNGVWSFDKYYKSSGITDPYKDCMNHEEIDKDPLAFFSLWYDIGKKNITSYIEAPLVLTLGLYHPYTKYSPTERNNYQWHIFIDSFYYKYNLYGIEPTSFLPALQTSIGDFIIEEKWSEIPVFHILWGAPFVTHVCLVLIFFILYRRKYQYLLPISLIFGLILTVVLAPLILYRYVFPAVLCLPIMLYIYKSVLK
jgi:hypothetical protein